MMPKVSICIPAYKQTEFLKVTLISVLEQRFHDYELIVSDDTPNDDVERLLSEFDFGRRLRYVRNQEALGSPRNWNASIELAEGEYIKMLHHDDHFSHPDALGRFVALLDDNPQAFFAFSGTTVENAGDGSLRQHYVTELQAQSLGLFPEQLFMGNLVGAPSATIVRRSLGLSYDTRMKWLVDLDYYIRALRICGVFAYTQEPLITTPTSAAHQVTELVRDDASVDIGEALMLFEICIDRLRSEQDAQEIWIRLFRKYNIRSPDQINHYGRVSVVMQSYFLSLYKSPRLRPTYAALSTVVKSIIPCRLARPLRNRQIISTSRNQAMNCLSGIYFALPQSFRSTWRRLKRNFGERIRW